METRNSRPVVGWIGGGKWCHLSFPMAEAEFEKYGGWAMDRATTEQLIRDLQEALDHTAPNSGK